MRILVVEDDEVLRSTVRATLEKDGHEVASTETAEDAMTYLAAREDALDLIFSDLKLPGADGLTLLRHLHKAKSSIPFVLMTAHGELDKAITSLQEGALDFLQKPIGRSDLRRAIEKLKEFRHLDSNGAPLFQAHSISLEISPNEQAANAAVQYVHDQFAGPLAQSRAQVRLLQSALHEAVLNAVIHGSRDTNSTIRITAALEPARFTMSVRDLGPGFDPSPYVNVSIDALNRMSTRGIPKMLASLNHCAWSFDEGTTVTMVQELGEAAD